MSRSGIFLIIEKRASFLGNLVTLSVRKCVCYNSWLSTYFSPGNTCLFVRPLPSPEVKPQDILCRTKTSRDEGRDTCWPTLCRRTSGDTCRTFILLWFSPQVRPHLIHSLSMSVTTVASADNFVSSCVDVSRMCIQLPWRSKRDGVRCCSNMIRGLHRCFGQLHYRSP